MSYTKEINYIYYVSDMEELPSAGHFRKMDAGREIARHIAKGLGNSRLIKYTEYEGELINATSVGIVFPTHMWGISLAVYTFLKHLRVTMNTYVYAVVVGESMSAGVDATLGRRMNSIERFRRIFVEKGLGSEKDVYIRCIDFKRDYDTTEEYIKTNRDKKERLGYIMEGLLFHSVDELNSKVSDDKINPEKIKKVYTEDKKSSRERNESSDENNENPSYDRDSRKITLTNVYLDEDILSGVRLCQVM